MDDLARKVTPPNLPSVSEKWKENDVYDFFYKLAKKLKVANESDTKSVEEWEKVLKVFNEN